MIEFRQKQFSEYDAMRQLYVQLDKLGLFRNRVIGVIDKSALIPILKGNNIVIEKFTQASRIFGKDRYRMYLKIGAKAKMPDEVRLPQYSRDKSLGNLQLNLNYGFLPDQNGGGDNKGGNNNQQGNNQTQGQSSTITPGPNTTPNNQQGQSQGGKGGKNKPGGKEKPKQMSEISPVESPLFRQKEFGAPPVANVSFRPSIDFLRYQVHNLLGDAIKYDKRERSLVLEFSDIDDAIKALNILPFGLGYKIYLLDA